MMDGPNMNDVAQRAGVHVATVSRALNGRPGVSAPVRERIVSVARELGYRINPLVAALIRSRRNPHRMSYHSTLGILEPYWPAGSEVFRQDYQLLIEGARLGASTLGYALEYFPGQEQAVSRRRLEQILAARNISGLLVPPLFAAGDDIGVGVAERPVMAIGYSLKLAVPRVTHDHVQGMRLAIEGCRRAGRRRVGLVLLRRVSEKVEDRWLAAFLARRLVEKEIELMPPLLVQEPGAAGEIEQWFAQYRPDAIIGLHHSAPLRDWNHSESRGGPGVWRVTLDRRDNDPACAGIDQHHRLIGHVAVEQLVHMVEKNQTASSKTPTKMMIEGTWSD